MNALNSLSQEELGSAAQRERRKRILDATIALASRGGFDAVQMRAVADQADVALGTLYRYFPSKIHLLVSALGREFERSQAAMSGKPIPGDTAEQRVNYVLGRTTKILQKDPNLTEALTRAFMFADASVSTEIHHVGMMLTSVLTEAMGTRTGDAEPTEEEIAIARVIGDVWLSSLVGWVTGRSSATDVETSMSVAVRLLLR
ncbi:MULTISPECIES: cholesterol catabolism transcriptional regulator KstR [unclassified Nocardioides]|uniref:cholesterol catabolism transcriptional regulator KstR n=1 Tax=unclassified Nocardioides TaxID=2615069 RepID=UPI0006F76061|nr:MULTISPECIES: cholesterol catabolism transcriptional regulator KstR [unclassified Nocardioides]KQY64151.1 transcriptional regulator [Nocardioides sp. Root140]KQZ70071.1 transcriptional regulator [Nocardioides sp. Root151]KRF16169.1 transcriptional regulator [Nocardioides sp. Soil796]